MPKANRIVVTGLGAVSGLGLGVENQWEALLAGKSSVRPIQHFDAQPFGGMWASVVDERDLDPRRFVRNQKLLRAMGKHSHIAFAAVAEAVEDAKIDFGRTPPERIGIFWGTGMIDYEVSDLSLAASRSTNKEGTLEWKRFAERGIDAIHPFFSVRLLNNATLCQLAIEYGIEGPNAVFSTFGEAGAQAVGEAMRAIARGEADIAIVGGTAPSVSVESLARFQLMEMLAGPGEEGHTAGGPWDADRTGFVLGEGGGVLILESLEHAARRGARVLAELLGYGSASGGPALEERADTVAVSARIALEDANRSISQVDYVHADASGLPVGDAAQSMGLSLALQAHAQQVLMSSSKGATGHMLAGAASWELVMTVKALRQKLIPATLGLKKQDPLCGPKIVVGLPRVLDLDVALCMSSGFAGQTAAIVVGSFYE
jgi:3-oxoacyl-[acyl-carrier-protein] synthase II